jgi:sodium/hydrogen exchanger family protein
MPAVSFTNLLIICAVAVLAPLLLGLLPRLRVPAVVLEIVAGIVLGPSVLGWVHVDLPVQILALFGLAFLLFLAGLGRRPPGTAGRRGVHRTRKSDLTTVLWGSACPLISQRNRAGPRCRRRPRRPPRRRRRDDPAVRERRSDRRVLDRAVARAVRVRNPPVRRRGRVQGRAGAGPFGAVFAGDAPDLRHARRVAAPPLRPSDPSTQRRTRSNQQATTQTTNSRHRKAVRQQSTSLASPAARARTSGRPPTTPARTRSRLLAQRWCRNSRTKYAHHHVVSESPFNAC